MADQRIGQLSPTLRVPELRGAFNGKEIAGGKATGEVLGGGAFGEILKDAISTVNELQKQSDQEIAKLMSGESQDLHATMIAVQKADLSFQTMMQVRNKIVAAYQEIMRMQV